MSLNARKETTLCIDHIHYEIQQKGDEILIISHPLGKGDTIISLEDIPKKHKERIIKIINAVKHKVTGHLKT